MVSVACVRVPLPPCHADCLVRGNKIARNSVPSSTELRAEVDQSMRCLIARRC